MKKHLALSLFLLFSTPLLAEESTQTDQENSEQQEMVQSVVSSQQEVIETTHEEQESSDHTDQQQQPEQESPKQSLISSFFKFIRIFVILLSNENVQNGIKMLDKMFVALVETAAQVVQSSGKVPEKKEEAIKAVADIDPAIKGEMLHMLLHQSRMIPILRKSRPSTAQQDKEEVQQILSSFAGVMQSFFTIVQDPENKDNVLQGLAGMLANVINAGKVIMKGSDILLEADKEIIKKAIAAIDMDDKATMLRFFQQPELNTDA